MENLCDSTNDFDKIEMLLVQTSSILLMAAIPIESPEEKA
jgi:hypothetical protein